MKHNIDLEEIKEIAIRAGKKILEIYYDHDFSQVVDFKDDQSPLTLADKASHEVIDKALKSSYPDIPVLSEEGKDIPYPERENWETFWLVDPLDGTKEFIKRNGEFTVNIALVHQGKPVLGIIYTPEQEELHTGSLLEGKEALKFFSDGSHIKLEAVAPENEVIAVRSSSHASEEEEKILKEFNVTNTISKGSSLKFCMVAEGKAHIYYRHGPTMEWDTGAGQAIVEAAGGKVMDPITGNDFTYNKEILTNGSFLVKSF